MAERISELNSQRMVLAVVCGPSTGFGGFMLHATGTSKCTSAPAMEAIARSVDAVVQALQLVAAANRDDEPPTLSDDDSLVAEAPPLRP